MWQGNFNSYAFVYKKVYALLGPGEVIEMCINQLMVTDYELTGLEFP